MPVLLAMLAATALTACDDRRVVRYRITATVNDNGRLISASAVHAESFTQQHLNIDGNLLIHAVYGDAIVLPIRGRLLVMTMRGWGTDYAGGDDIGCTGGAYSPQSFAPANRDWVTRFHPEGIPCVLTRSWSLRGDPADPATLRNDHLPAFITFDGAPSLNGTRIVDVTHLERYFGPGVSLRSVTVQPTDASVSRTVDKQLPFPVTMPSSYVCVAPGGSGTETRLGDGRSVTRNLDPALGDCAREDMFRQ